MQFIVLDFTTWVLFKNNFTIMPTVPVYNLVVFDNSVNPPQLVTGLTQLNLRVSPFSTAAFTMDSEISTGVYKFLNVTAGLYKVYNNTTELTKFGYVTVGEPTAVLTTGNQTVAGDKTFTGSTVLGNTLSTGTLTIDTGQHIVDPNAPTLGSHLSNKTYVDGAISDLDLTNKMLRKDSGASNEQVLGHVNFRTYPPTSSIAATALAHLTRRQDMINYVQEVLNGFNPSAYQQSGNIVRCIPSGTQETNKVYRTLSASLTNAASFADATRRMVVEMHGTGDSDTNLTDATLLPAGSADDYVDIICKGQCIVRVAEDTYTGSFDRSIIVGATFDNEAENAVTYWENKIFVDCNFINSFGSGSPIHDFDTCVFKNCTISTGYTFVDCVGDLKDATTGQPVLRRLGISASGATAGSLTLGEGNFFSLTGTTTINLIATAGWTIGSRITLVCPDGTTTLTHNASPGGGFAAMKFKAASNKSLTTGICVSLVLVSSSVWFED